MPELDLLTERDGSGKVLFRVDEDWKIDLAPGCSITVPEGYVSNLASVPRIFYFVAAPSDIAHEAIVHDWMCGEYIPNVGSTRPPEIYSRWFADAVLKEMLRRNKEVAPWRKWAIYRAVRIYARKEGLE